MTQRLTTARGRPRRHNAGCAHCRPLPARCRRKTMAPEKPAHFPPPIPRQHARQGRAPRTFTVTGDITRYTRAKMFSKSATTPPVVRFSTVAGVSVARPTPA